MNNWKTIGDNGSDKSFEYYTINLGDFKIALDFDEGSGALDFCLEESYLKFEATSPEEAKRIALIKLKEYFLNIVNQLDQIGESIEHEERN